MRLNRNRAGVLSLIGLLLTCFSMQAAANVIGFDFGSTFFKITLVQPGNPFAIVENTTSKRKTDSQWTITKDVRLFGADSFIGTSRNPKTTFADTASFLGMEYDADAVARMASDKFILNDMVEDERGLIAFQTFSINKKELKEDPDAKTTYFSEELVASILAYGKGLAEAQAKSKVKDAVITVPSYYDQERRLMLIDAAELAGLNVIQLIHENSAAAVMYGIDRLDTESDLNVLIYNMGGRDTEVSVVRYSAVTDSKKKTYEHVEILGEGFDETLGGKAFDDVLVQILAEKFNSMKERQGKADVRENGRVMKRLYKESSNIKDILSANKSVNVKIPELLDYVTLAFELTREEFEQKCDELYSRVQGPINSALEQAGLSASDINQVEILGGGIRVPKVQAILKETMNDMELNVHLNGDEAMSFGAAFIASNSSASYKVRKVYLTQHPRNNIRIKITPLTMEGEEADLESSEIEYSKDVVLYSKSDYLGQRKTIHLDYDKNMRIVASNVFDDDSEEDLVSFEVTGIDKIMDKDEFKNGNTTTPKVSLSFELSRSNLFQLSSAKLTSNSTTYELVEKKKKKEEPKKKETEDEAFDEDEVKTDETSDAAVDDAPESADAEPDSDADNKEEATESEAEPEAEAEEEAEPEYKEVIKPLDYPLDKINESRIGARTLDKTQKKAAEKRLKALAKRDEDKQMADEAKNQYESQIYALRAWLNDEDNSVFVTEEEREAWLEKLETGEDWLYDEGSDQPYTEYKERSNELTQQFELYDNRKEEYYFREHNLPGQMEQLVEQRAQLAAIRDEKDWITEKERDDVLEKMDDIAKWVEEKTLEQESKAITEEPAFFQYEYEDMAMKMVEKYIKLLNKTKPKEKKPKKKKVEKEDEAKTEETDAKAEDADAKAEEGDNKEEPVKEEDHKEPEPEMATDEL